ncbi:ATP-dependent Clp protease ATP-binding subunit [Musa troglodytarum]|uniref:ATP-dependent Clp protease ATP-binding subunit n=1 Tax=Musa troglodytarum TaxID=320322 RepID=A0A9E7KR02_9LILI|nr:ATP-dependent Clp protease ATP-binding subunit [Musa troglodytarum]URE28493.1 ATP-dependent Clp protease ATP-binding subunit [Musa troglodytarum]
MAARILSFLPIPTASSRSSAPVKSMSSLSPPRDHHAVRLRSFLIAIPISVAPSLLFPRPSLRSAAAVVSILPTAKPERASAEKLPSNGGGNECDRWSLRAIKAFGMAELEARKLKYPNTGTEALLMGILVEGEDGEITTAHLLLGIWSEKESAGHKILASLGFDDEKASELAKSADKDIVMKYR